MNVKFLISIIAASLMSACQSDKLRELEYEVQYLQNENSQLKDKMIDNEKFIFNLKSEIANLRDKSSEVENIGYENENLKQLLELARFEYEDYRYGKGTCVTRVFRGNSERSTVCGAENIIKKLQEGYCHIGCSY